MPLIGHEVELPRNEKLRAIFEQLLKDDDMSIEEFRSHAGENLTSAKGSQRKVLAEAKDVTYDVVKMQDANEDLLTPDYLFKPDPTPTIDESKPF